MEESYLCRWCRSVNWDAAFAPIPPGQSGGRTVLKFRSTLEIRGDIYCRLCLAITSLFKLEDAETTGKLDKRFSLVAARSSTVHASFWSDNNSSKYLSEQMDCPTWLVGKIDDPKHFANARTSFAQPRVIVENRALEPAEYGLEFGTPRRTVDFHRLRRWLDGEVCPRHPDHELSAHTLDLPGMRAIDCELREIVPLLGAHPKYATLSYVWGQSGPRAQQTENCLTTSR